MKNYYVVYNVTGHGEKRAGPYVTYHEAKIHLDDIAGYEDVTDAKIVAVER